METFKQLQNKQATVPLWTRDFILITVANLFIFCGFQMLPSTLPVWVKSLGAADSTVGWVTGITTISAVLARPFVGLAVDRFGRRGLLLVGLILMLVTTFSYAVFPIIAIVLTIRLIQGVSWAIANTASQTVAADVIPQKRFAEGMGFFMQSGAIALTVAPGLALYLLYNAGIDAMVTVSSGLFGIAFLLVVFMRFKDIRGLEQSESVIRGSQAFERHSDGTLITEALADPAGITTPITKPDIIEVIAEIKSSKKWHTIKAL